MYAQTSLQTTRQAGKKNQIIPCERRRAECRQSRVANGFELRKRDGTYLEDVVDDEMTRNDDDEQTHVNPAEEGELLREVLLLKVGNESDEA